MTKEELEKEAGNWLRKYLLCCNCEKKCNCIDSNSYCEEQVLKAYIASAEPREKRIEELEMTISKMEKGTCDICKETEKDKKIADLEKENVELKEKNNRLNDKIVDLGCKVSEANSNAVIWTEELVAENKYLAKQLTKAKELLKQWLQTSKASGCDNINIITDTEQFLSEVEK